VTEVSKKAFEQVACYPPQREVPSQLQTAFWRGALPGTGEEVIGGLPTDSQVRMLGRATLEFNFPPIDNYGPNQIPVFQNPQGCKARLTDVLAQLPVTSCENKGAL
jgi:hypothetical protein